MQHFFNINRGASHLQSSRTSTKQLNIGCRTDYLSKEEFNISKRIHVHSHPYFNTSQLYSTGACLHLSLNLSSIIAISHKSKSASPHSLLPNNDLTPHHLIIVSLIHQQRIPKTSHAIPSTLLFPYPKSSTRALYFPPQNPSFPPTTCAPFNSFPTSHFLCICRESRSSWASVP